MTLKICFHTVQDYRNYCKIIACYHPKAYLSRHDLAIHAEDIVAIICHHQTEPWEMILPKCQKNDLSLRSALDDVGLLVEK